MTTKKRLTETVINLLPGDFKIDSEVLPWLKKMKKFLEDNIGFADLSEFKNTGKVDEWLARFKNIESPGEFNIFMKIYVNFVLPMKNSQYKELLVRTIKLFDSKKIEKSKIVEMIDTIREFLSFLEKKYGKDWDFLENADG